MSSIAFPKMFNKTSTNIVTDLEATKQNGILLLSVETNELFGDPYFGIKARKLLFEQNNVILKDIFIDEIYIKLAVFMPQIILERKDIDIISDRGILYAKFKARNVTSYELDTYQLVLYNENEV